MERVEIESCLEARSDGRVEDGSFMVCDKVRVRRVEWKWWMENYMQFCQVNMTYAIKFVYADMKFFYVDGSLL